LNKPNLIDDTVLLVDVDETMDRIQDMPGKPQGLTTGWYDFDQFYTVPPIGQLNLITGTPNSGKSEWLDSLALNLAQKHNWKIFTYAPENYPADFHIIKLCEKMAGKPLWGNWTGYENITTKEYSQCREFIREHWDIVNCHIDNANIDKILNTVFNECLLRKIDMAIIDPWNKVEHQVPKGVKKLDYIAKQLVKIQMFARRQNMHWWIVAHPAKPTKLKDGTHSKVSLYDVSGSSDFYNMIDNGFIAERDWEKRSALNNSMTIRTGKIKERWYGKCGECQFEFEPACGRYKTTHLGL
jgi:twinkle protein